MTKMLIVSGTIILPYDSYLAEALDKAYQLQALDSRFTLLPDQHLTQGKPNRVLRVRYDDQPVILKYYGEQWNVPGAVRKASELFYLEHYAASDVVPRLVRTDFDRVLLLEEVPGITLKVFHNQHFERDGWEQAVRCLSFELGQAYARLAALLLPDALRRTFEEQFCQGQELETTIEDLLSQAERLCDTVETFGEERDTILFIRSKIPFVLRQPLPALSRTSIDNLSFSIATHAQKIAK